MISANMALFCLIQMANPSLTSDEQSSIELWLSGISLLMAVLIIGLVTLALIIRHLSKNSTRPCPSCMEFISKKADVCPRCGNNIIGK